VKEHHVITESQQPTAPVFGRDGEPCPACGAPLAGDQRYCLHCGARRPEARLEFLDVLDADVRARQAVLPAGGPPYGGVPAAGLIPAAAAAPPPSGLNGRLQANAGLLALGALLLLMLLVGLLLGHWVTDRQDTPSGAAAAPAPQVIKVEGTAAAPSASAPAATDATAAAKTSKGSSKKSSSSSSSKAKATAPKDSVSVKSLSSKKAVEDAVKKGKPISTGTGKLPAKDDKAPAGGAGFEDIG
jgi:hypothetical protein